MDNSFEKMATQWLGGREPSTTTDDQAGGMPDHHHPASRVAGTSNALPYHDTGSLVIDKVCDTLTTLHCAARLSGVGEVPELSEMQPVPHPAFALMHVPTSIMPVAGSILEVDVMADPQYAGWSPGSTSLAGYAREMTFWRRVKRGAQPPGRTWLRVSPGPSHSVELLIARWEETRDGFGESWSEMESYQQVRALIGPSDYTWRDPHEGFKIRHQIADLIARTCTGPIPSLEDIGMTSLASLLFCEGQRRDAGFSTVDVIQRLLEAHMLTRLLERAPKSWHGGITPRVVLYMAAADLWTKNIEFQTITSGFGIQAHTRIRNQQLDGLITFAREMNWPFAYEIVEGASELRPQQSFPNGLPIPFWDWLNGVVLPGDTFPAVMILGLYGLSTTLRPHVRHFAFRTHKANFGILYPRSSYWNVRSIVGKVLAPMSLVDARRINCLAGWVGPCPTTNSFPVANVGLAVQVDSMQPSVFTAGTEADEYARRAGARTPKPSDKTTWIQPEIPDTSAESVSLQALFVPEDPRGAESEPYGVAYIDCHFWLKDGPKATFRLLFNCVFLSAPPCRGIHRIDPRNAADYSFRTLELSDLATGGSYTLSASEALDVFAGKQYLLPQHKEAIQVINATSGGAAETYARAWCSWVGSNAVIWKKDAGKSCFKCALMTAGREGLATGTLIIC